MTEPESFTRLDIGLASVDDCRAWETGQLRHDMLHNKQHTKVRVRKGSGTGRRKVPSS